MRGEVNWEVRTVVYRLLLDTNLLPPVLFPVHPIPSSLCVSVPLCFKSVRGLRGRETQRHRGHKVGLFRDCVSIPIFSHPFYFLLTPSRLPSVLSVPLCFKIRPGIFERGVVTTQHAIARERFLGQALCSGRCRHKLLTDGHLLWRHGKYSDRRSTLFSKPA